MVHKVQGKRNTYTNIIVVDIYTQRDVMGTLEKWPCMPCLIPVMTVCIIQCKSAAGIDNCSQNSLSKLPSQYESRLFHSTPPLS
jgi:hypothetical protein